MGKDPFAALPPVPDTFEIAGERIDLTPLKVGEVPAFARAVQPLAASLSASPDWLALMAEHGDTVIVAIAVATRRPVEWVAGLDLDEAVRLAEAVFGVNANFFMRRLLPALTAATDRAGALMTPSTPGPMPASD